MSRQSPKSSRAEFAETISRDDEHLDLSHAALLIAAEEYPHLDSGVYFERLDHFADLARERAADARDAGDVITALNSVMFDVLGFRGNRENYYDPRNSFLNQVIDRRTGIPITMTVVYIEVARRIGFPIKGVGMPFHFIAKHEAESGDIFIDTFNEGKVLGRAGCSELVAGVSGGKLELSAEHLAPVTKKQILLRMLSNLLKHLFGERSLAGAGRDRAHTDHRSGFSATHKRSRFAP